MRIIRCAVFSWDSVNYLCALMPISFASFWSFNYVAHLESFCARAIYLYYCAFWTSLFLRILDLSYFCTFWISLFLRILNSINYDCPCIHFIFAQYYFQYFANFLHPSFLNQSIILHFANFLRSSLMDQGLLHFANIIHLFIDQGFSHSANILHSSFHRSGLFLHFANIIHPSFHWSRPFSCISRIAYIHLFIVQGLFLLHF